MWNISTGARPSRLKGQTRRRDSVTSCGAISQLPYIQIKLQSYLQNTGVYFQVALALTSILKTKQTFTSGPKLINSTACVYMCVGGKSGWGGGGSRIDGCKCTRQHAHNP